MTEVTELMEQVGRISRSLACAMKVAVGVSLMQCEIICRLYGCTTNVPQQALERALEIDAGALSRLLQTLEADGVLKRNVDAMDRRVVRVSLTEEGRATAARVLAYRNTFLGGMFGSPPDESVSELYEALCAFEVLLLNEL